MNVGMRLQNHKGKNLPTQKFWVPPMQSSCADAFASLLICWIIPARLFAALSQYCFPRILVCNTSLIRSIGVINAVYLATKARNCWTFIDPL